MQPSTSLSPPEDFDSLPDHTQLPDKDDSIVENFQEAPQSVLLTGSLKPRLDQLHPEGNYIIGTDSGIYWRHTNPPLAGCKSPDWFYVPGVPRILKGRIRRSYVLWKEHVRPLLAIEYVSGNGSEEHDDTPYTGKYWVYEQGICIQYYAIFDGFRDTLELYALRNGHYEPVSANAAGRYPVEPLGVELGLWQALYEGMPGTWLRAWDSATGEMLPSAEERTEATESVNDELGRELSDECERAENERKRANRAEKQARTAAKRAKTEAKRAELATKQAEAEAKRAETEARRAETEARRATLADEEAKSEAKRSTALQSQIDSLHERLRAMGLDPETLS
jgi:Uma2 family endonuclease